MSQTESQTQTGNAQMSTEVSKNEPSGIGAKNLNDMIEKALQLGKMDPKLLANANKDEILELRKKLNPYGRTIKGADEFVNLSITGITHKWWERFLVTAFIGYLNRMCDEWRVPKGVPIVPVNEYIKDPSKADIPKFTLETGDPHVVYDFQYNKEFMEKRLIVKAFLEEMFQFNPDEHVRSSYSPNLDDSKRKPVATMAAEHALMHLEKIDPVFRAQKQRHERINGATPVKMKKVKKVKKIKKIIKNREGKVLREVFEDREYEEEVPDIEANVAEKQKDKEKYVNNEFCDMIPPLDLFYNFDRYRKEHYEDLREATSSLYNEVPYFEFAVNVYGSFKKEEDALAHRRQHANEVITEVFTIPTGKWCFFDSFKEQRESVEFYNDRTAVLEAIMRQVEQDEKIAASLVEKVVKKEKRKNIIEQGPDAESFAQWKAENKEISKASVSNSSDDSATDGTVELRVWKLGKSGAELTSEKMQILAESPDFVKDLQHERGVTVRMPGEKGEVSLADATSAPALGPNALGPAKVEGAPTETKQ